MAGKQDPGAASDATLHNDYEDWAVGARKKAGWMLLKLACTCWLSCSSSCSVFGHAATKAVGRLTVMSAQRLLWAPSYPPAIALGSCQRQPSWLWAPQALQCAASCPAYTAGGVCPRAADMQLMLSLAGVQVQDLTGLEVRVSHRAVFEASLAYLGLPRVSPDMPAVSDCCCCCSMGAAC